MKEFMIYLAVLICGEFIGMSWMGRVRVRASGGQGAEGYGVINSVDEG